MTAPTLDGKSLGDPPGNLSPEDHRFLTSTLLLESLSPRAARPLLACLTPQEFPAGIRLITQGEEGDALYIVQDGLCAVRLAGPEGETKVAQRGPGNVLGEMALLTGDRRVAHVDIETPARLWRLGREDFDRLVASHVDLREFLTNLLTRRLEMSEVLAVRQVGRYAITGRLGQGGWSLVYGARHVKLGLPVAIKMLKHNLAMEPDFMANFGREARLIASLDHANVVKVFDIEELYRTVFIVMEHLEGEPLDRVLARQGGLPLERGLGVLRQVCAGLAYAHDRGIVHRDIKPANLFLLGDERVKILDFGLACARGEEADDPAGTPNYMPPEQIRMEPVDQRSDIYALGLSAYEIFTGRTPFPGASAGEVIRQHLEKDLPDPGLIVPGLPQALRDFMLQAGQRDPGQRQQSMDQVLAQLEPLNAPLPPTAKDLVSVLLVRHGQDQQGALSQLLEEMNARAEELGLGITLGGQGKI